MKEVTVVNDAREEREGQEVREKGERKEVYGTTVCEWRKKKRNEYKWNE